MLHSCAWVESTPPLPARCFGSAARISRSSHAWRSTPSAIYSVRSCGGALRMIRGAPGQAVQTWALDAPRTVWTEGIFRGAFLCSAGEQVGGGFGRRSHGHRRREAGDLGEHRARLVGRQRVGVGHLGAGDLLGRGLEPAEDDRLGVAGHRDEGITVGDQLLDGLRRGAGDLGLLLDDRGGGLDLGVRGLGRGGADVGGGGLDLVGLLRTGGLGLRLDDRRTGGQGIDGGVAAHATGEGFDRFVGHLDGEFDGHWSGSCAVRIGYIGTVRKCTERQESFFFSSPNASVPRTDSSSTRPASVHFSPYSRRSLRSPTRLLSTRGNTPRISAWRCGLVRFSRFARGAQPLKASNRSEPTTKSSISSPAVRCDSANSLTGDCRSDSSCFMSAAEPWTVNAPRRISRRRPSAAHTTMPSVSAASLSPRWMSSRSRKLSVSGSTSMRPERAPALSGKSGMVLQHIVRRANSRTGAPSSLPFFSSGMRSNDVTCNSAAKAAVNPRPSTLFSSGKRTARLPTQPFSPKRVFASSAARDAAPTDSCPSMSVRTFRMVPLPARRG